MTAFMRSIQILNQYSIPYRTFIRESEEIVIRYNENGEDFTDEVYAGNGTIIRIVNVWNGNINIQEGGVA